MDIETLASTVSSGDTTIVLGAVNIADAETVLNSEMVIVFGTDNDKDKNSPPIVPAMVLLVDIVTVLKTVLSTVVIRIDDVGNETAVSTVERTPTLMVLVETKLPEANMVLIELVVNPLGAAIVMPTKTPRNNDVLRVTGVSSTTATDTTGVSVDIPVTKVLVTCIEMLVRIVLVSLTVKLDAVESEVPTRTVLTDATDNVDAALITTDDGTVDVSAVKSVLGATNVADTAVVIVAPVVSALAEDKAIEAGIVLAEDVVSVLGALNAAAPRTVDTTGVVGVGLIGVAALVEAFGVPDQP